MPAPVGPALGGRGRPHRRPGPDRGRQRSTEARPWSGICAPASALERARGPGWRAAVRRRLLRRRAPARDRRVGWDPEHLGPRNGRRAWRRSQGIRGRSRTSRSTREGNRALTASGDTTAKLWDLDANRLAEDLLGHRGWVSTAAFAPDERTVLTASQDGTARIWDAAPGRPSEEFNAGFTPTSATFGPDGQSVLTAAAGH